MVFIKISQNQSSQSSQNSIYVLNSVPFYVLGSTILLFMFSFSYSSNIVSLFINKLSSDSNRLTRLMKKKYKIFKDPCLNKPQKDESNYIINFLENIIEKDDKRRNTETQDSF